MIKKSLSSNLVIQFSENILKYSNEYKLPPDQLGTILFVLFAIYEQKEYLLDYLDDKNSSRRMNLLYHYLVSRGFLMETERDERYLYTLTEDAVEFIELTNLEEEVRVIESDSLKEQKIRKEESVEDWIEDYIKLFPREKVQSRYLRTTAKECVPKMHMFIKNFGYDKETILSATKAYLKEQSESKDGYTYTRNSSYFIGKQLGKTSADKISDLATWCARQLDEKESPQENVYDKLV